MLPCAPPPSSPSPPALLLLATNQFKTNQCKSIKSNHSIQTTQFKPINSNQSTQHTSIQHHSTQLHSSICQEHFGAPLSHFVPPRAFPSTPIALCASLMGGDLNAMSRGARRTREWLRARFGHPYRTFAPVCFTLAHAKSISEHPYRTLCLSNRGRS